jgi:formylglycine-generating enzyme
MGTDYAEGFPEDGEGPVRPVVLLPFSIDIAPVTNAQFAKFVQASGYVTEAERFGWSFVFWADIPRDRYRDLVSDTVAQTPWWCQVRGSKWNSPEGPGSSIDKRLDHPVVHVSWNDAASITGSGVVKGLEVLVGGLRSTKVRVSGRTRKRIRLVPGTWRSTSPSS